jgi:transketolase
MRTEFYRLFPEMVRADNSIYLLSPDFSLPAGFDLKVDGIDHLIHTGLTEGATMGIASGMALSGLKPYVIGIAPFVLERPYEQIKLDLVEQGANVKVIGYWDYPTAGPTHKPRDVSKLCDILEIALLQPKNIAETREMLLEEAKKERPCFIYLRKDGTVK